VWLLLGLLLVALPVNAQEMASMEIHIQDGDTVTVYECWPSLESDTDRTIVVSNYVQGSAMYTCYMADRYEVTPILPVDQYQSHA
jgi:hypothetical protein